MSHTIEDVLAVAGNRPVFEALVSILEAGKAIVFVGAGASAPMYPLWGRFIELLAEHAVAEGKAEARDAKRWKADTTSNPQQRVNVILRKLGEPLYRNFLRDTFGPRNGADGRRYTAPMPRCCACPFAPTSRPTTTPRWTSPAPSCGQRASAAARRPGRTTTRSIAGAPVMSSTMTARCSGSMAIGSARPASC